MFVKLIILHTYLYFEKLLNNCMYHTHETTSDKIVRTLCYYIILGFQMAKRRFGDISGLGKVELNKICKQEKVALDYSKIAKVIW